VHATVWSGLSSANARLTSHAAAIHLKLGRDTIAPEGRAVREAVREAEEMAEVVGREVGAVNGGVTHDLACRLHQHDCRRQLGQRGPLLARLSQPYRDGTVGTSCSDAPAPELRSSI
jgi:hypothetical protein